MTPANDATNRDEQPKPAKRRGWSFLSDPEWRRQRHQSQQERAAQFRQRDEYPRLFNEWKRELAQALQVSDDAFRVLPMEESYRLGDLMLETSIQRNSGEIEFYDVTVPFDQRAHGEEIVRRFDACIPDEDVFLQCQGVMNFGVVVVEKSIALRAMFTILGDSENKFVDVVRAECTAGLMLDYSFDNGLPEWDKHPGYQFSAWGDWCEALRGTELPA